MNRNLLVVTLFFVLCISISAQQNQEKLFTNLLNDADGLSLINTKAEVVEYKNVKGLRVSKADNYESGATLVIIPGVMFSKGTIELELSGERAPDEDSSMRGFVGLAFRIDGKNFSNYECFYLRPANGRAENQLQRNHSAQYVSHPEYPWYKLREENPGMYESYVDLVPGEWTKIKIVVEGVKAKLFVNNIDQPTLIVNDLKYGVSEGGIALWLHPSTIAHFRNLHITTKVD